MDKQYFIGSCKNALREDKLVEIDDEIKINHYNEQIQIMPFAQTDGEIYKSLVEAMDLSWQTGNMRSFLFFEDMMNRKYIIINGRPYPNLTELMNIFAKNIVALQQELGPTHYSKYVHGDLPLRNIFIMPDKELKIADVRGQNVDPTSPDKTSVEFDIAKIVHSFFLELIRGKYYTLSASREGSNFNFDFNYQSENPSVNKYLEVWKNIYSVLKNNPDLQALFANAKGNWLEHIKLAECSNYASDAIHRFSQDPTGQDAIAYYLNAVMMFYELLKSHDMIDDNWNVLINEKFKNENKDTTTGDEEY
jgi:serine/threonine-protein kinase RIO1